MQFGHSAMTAAESHVARYHLAGVCW